MTLSVCGMLERENCNTPALNTQVLSLALRSVRMAAPSPVGVGMAPSVCGMLERENCSKPSPATRTVSIALRSVRMEKPSPVGVGVTLSVCGMLERERCNTSSPNTRTLSIALHSVRMEKPSPVGVTMAPCSCGTSHPPHRKPSAKISTPMVSSTFRIWCWLQEHLGKVRRHRRRVRCRWRVHSIGCGGVAQ